uniref:CAZy families GT2 protein n=1 Tax=uncultured Acidimicrobium sp. TaxID=221084 RepID=A0A060BYH0_9ACTN|nr:CAZy families GT2 protein [uncultured Acidimicrobium sp.]
MPDGGPRTKPPCLQLRSPVRPRQVCGDLRRRGRPESDQLLHVLAGFRHMSEVARVDDPHDLACRQASLSYYNADYNVLTRLFAIE